MKRAEQSMRNLQTVGVLLQKCDISNLAVLSMEIP